MDKDVQGRKWQLTINNPETKGWTHQHIKEVIAKIKSCEYYCMADEIGLENQTPHTHIFLQLKSPAKFSRIKKEFPDAHIERVRGTAQANKDYILKQGKWASDEKADTSVPNTFEEHGTLPDEKIGHYQSEVGTLYCMIAEGLSNGAIMTAQPDLARYISTMDKIRQDILSDRFKTTFRELEVIYIFGSTETGKTRSVMEMYGYGNVYRITDYNHPFDSYQSEPVMCFDEFRSSLPLGDMLNYLDGYPLMLPARYANKTACYETVYLISNISLEEQYPYVQQSEPASWKAFLRRIKIVIEYKEDGSTVEHGSGTEYCFYKKEGFTVTQEEIPF